MEKILISNLSDDILQLVVDCLNLPDLYRFGWVCKPWKSICNPMQFLNHLPWLIVPNNNFSSSSHDQLPLPKTIFEDVEDIGFYSLRDKKIYKAELPELLNRRICASFPGGWLMTVHENSEIQLFKPFSATQQIIHLPSLTEFPRILRTEMKENNELFYIGTRFDYDELFCHPSKYVRDTYIHKVAMSSRISSTLGTIVMAIQSNESSLAYYRIGGDQHVWTPVSLANNYYYMCDLTYYKGKFYAVHNNGYVVVVRGLEEGEESREVFIEQVIDEPTGKFSSRSYIVESQGDLLVFFRFRELTGITNDIYELFRSPHRTVGFRVLKLEFGAPNNRWVEVKSLGNCSLFLGFNMSISVSSSNLSGCKANCIYFTDDKHFYDHNFGGYDMGIFHLEDGSIEKFLYPSEFLVAPLPIWFAPN